uniref:Putative terminase n=1 Tax=viral metagenome TaxID=1070528 RepID=A0A6M3IQ84_9ZZZZ
MKLSPDFPLKLQFLFNPHRYKVARGGRGGSKSWGFARAILVLGAAKKIRVLCAREVQLSIKNSVHKLLSDQVELMGLSGHYRVLESEIRGTNGTNISFSGLSAHTVESIKSFEAVDICWVEEGQTVSKRSWDILLPTIRKEGSEVWVSYNPDLETDETHQRFTVHPMPDTINVEINWRDNPWFSDVSDKQRRHCQQFDPDNYDNIWEGKCRPAVEGAIYYKQIQEVEAQGRICNVPYDAFLKVHVVMDLGWDDSLSAALVQKNTSEIRIVEYIEASHTKLDVFSSELRTRPYNWGKVWLPHDGFSGSLNSGGKSTYDLLKALGWSVAKRSEIVELSVEEGIRNTRLMFDRIYFDKTKTNAIEGQGFATDGFGHTDLNWRLIECLKRYRRHINQSTQAASTPIKDDYTHGADAFRYVCLNADKMENVVKKARYIPAMSYEPLDAMVGI